MNPTLAVFVLAAAVALAGWALAAAALRRGPGAGLVGALLVLELAVVVQAVVQVHRLLAGQDVAEPATHVGYLITSAVVLPVLFAVANPRQPATGWSSAVVAVACVTLAIVQVRLIGTGPGTATDGFSVVG